MGRDFAPDGLLESAFELESLVAHPTSPSPRMQAVTAFILVDFILVPAQYSLKALLADISFSFLS
jgi:hypothetical protein